jgi:hypothetical protein
MNRLFHHHPLLIGLVGCSALTWSLPLSAATFTWNKNLTPGDTAIYDMWDDTNWTIVGTPTGSLQSSNGGGTVSGGPRTGDSIVVPDGVIARMNDNTGTGNAPDRFFAGITVGSALPGESQIEFHNSYTGKNVTFFVTGDVTGDSTNTGKSFVRLSGRQAALKTQGSSNVTITDFNTDMPQSEFTAPTTLVGNNDMGTTQVRTDEDIRVSGSLPDRFEFRQTSSASQVFADGPLDYGLVRYRDNAGTQYDLGNFDHIIGDIDLSGGGFGTGSALTMTGGSITMDDWSRNQFEDNEVFELSQTEIRMFGGSDDTDIVLAIHGRDDGASLAGYDDNFALGSLIVGDDAGDVITLFDDGAYATGSESSLTALYVGTLDLSSDASLIVGQDMRLYYQTLVGDLDNVTGAGNVIAIPEPGTVALVGLGLALVLHRRRNTA